MSAAINLETIQPLRRRDLHVVRRDDRDGSEDWVIKDPVQLNYFFLDKFQYWLFQQFDGNSTLAQIRTAFNNAFSPSSLTETQLLTFCLRLSRDGLLCENVSGSQLIERDREKRRSSWLKKPLSILAIRLPGFNARRFIDIASMIGGWMFSPVAVVLTLFGLVLAALCGIGLIDELVLALPALESIRPSDVVIFVACIAGVKIVHELAHAVCCRQMGAQCNEIGMMFLVFSPCLYCNVSDSWMLPEKWKRIAISAAGIYVELIIAATSLILWHYCQQPVLKNCLLNLFIICSVSTLLINGNPLMRYDGYFILSDLTGIPNLSQQSRRAAMDLLGNAWFVLPQRVDRQQLLGKSLFLLGYYFASLAYRTIVMAVIIGVIYSILEPIGLGKIAVGFGCFYFLSMLMMFAVGMTRVLKDRNRKGRKNFFGIVTTVLLIGIGGWLIGNLKIPYRILSEAVIEIDDLANCSASTDGVKVWTIPESSVVKAGDIVAKLENVELKNRRLELTGEIELLQKRYKNMESRSSSDPKLRVSLPGAEAAYLAAVEQLRLLEAESEQLTVKAPKAGIVLAAHSDSQETTGELELAAWEGNLLDPANEGCFVRTGDTICMIGEAGKFKAWLLLDERKMDLVDVGDKVEIRTAIECQQTYLGKIASISATAIVSGDQSESDPTRVARRGYRAEVTLDEPIQLGFHGAAAKARITLEEQTLFEITRRFLIESFSFDGVGDF